MNWQDCFPGQIVFIKHFDEFKKRATAHPYLVYGRQGFHSHNKKANIVCFRITSKIDTVEDKVMIPSSICNSLDKDSAIVYNAEHLFNANDALLIGQCEWEIFEEVIKKRKRYLAVQQQDAEQALKNIKRYQERKGTDNNSHYWNRKNKKESE